MINVSDTCVVFGLFGFFLKKMYSEMCCVMISYSVALFGKSGGWDGKDCQNQFNSLQITEERRRGGGR